MELKLNDEPLFNVLLVLNNMHNHAMLSSNTNQFKFALFVNSNALVFPKLIHNLISHNGVLNFLMLHHSYNKLVLLVLLKILYVDDAILFLNHIFFVFVVTPRWLSCWFQC